MSESRTDDEECDSDVPLPPDGGWGWVVTLSSFMISFLVDGVCFTFGLFLPSFLEYFGGSKGKTALLGSVMNGMYLSFGKNSFVKNSIYGFGKNELLLLHIFQKNLPFTFSENKNVVRVFTLGQDKCTYETLNEKEINKDQTTRD